MKFIRAELHNHSTESDGALSVESLAAYAAEKNFEIGRASCRERV